MQQEVEIKGMTREGYKIRTVGAYTVKGKSEINVIQTKGNTHKGITHGGSSGGGGASLTISTRRPGTPIVAIWYESSPVS
jgi:hypothetical protein